MRRKDREITDRNQIIDMLQRCDTVRIAMNKDKQPYIVPVSFGMEIVGNMPVIYFHCAKEGLKIDLLQKDSRVCIEADTFLGVEKTEHGITTRYESVIGFGRCKFAEEEAEITKGINLILAHYGYFDYPLDDCRGLTHMKIGKITLEEIYGKRNPPAQRR